MNYKQSEVLYSEVLISYYFSQIKMLLREVMNRIPRQEMVEVLCI